MRFALSLTTSAVVSFKMLTRITRKGGVGNDNDEFFLIQMIRFCWLDRDKRSRSLPVNLVASLRVEP